MFTITRFSVLVVATIVATASFAQTRTGHTGAQARQFVSNARFVITDDNSDPTFVQFEDNTPFGTIASMPATFRLAIGCDLKRTGIVQDKLGDQHFKYQETYNDIEIRGAEYVFHIRGNNWVTKANGRLHRQVQMDTNPSLTEEQALEIAIAQVGAQDYAWEDQAQEAFLRSETNNPDTTYFPQAELAISSRDYRKGAPLQLIYSFDIYASQPLGRYTVEVDAHTGEIVNKYNKIHHNVVNGSGQTLYDGEVSMLVTEDASNYYLGETTRGEGIYTYDMQNSTNYSGAQLFMEGDSHFDEQHSQAGVSAHFGAGATYDYFLHKHGRNSFNDAGAAIRSYVHYSNDYVNAFWDGSRMTYGDGNGTSITALVSLDIVGHEIAHAVTQYSAGLIYQNESGALNESFSDIFGQSIEFETFPATASWNLGDQIFTSGTGMIRSISDPNSQGQPDTYLGELWYTGSGDNGGVHYNSGVQNFWYYLLVEGGTGTNDFGYAYEVPTIGRDAADAIAYRNLTVYLTSSSTYIDARVGAEQSAIDLYGENSIEHLAVIEAWNAVGVPTTEPVLTVASSLDVGYGIINETSVVDLRIINSGFEQLDVTRIDVGDAVFSLVESTFSVAPQASYDLGVTFTPAALQQYDTEMTIYSNADTAVVALQGIGSERPSITLSEDHFSLTHAAGEVASYPVTLTNNHSTTLNFTLTTDAVRRPTPSFVPTTGSVTVGKTEVNAYRQVSSLTGTDTLSGYVWADSDEGVAFDWLDIQTLGTTVTLGDDDNSNLIPLGFDFAFFEDPYSSISISSNGWISFTETSFGLWTTPLPSNSAPRNVIAWMGHDLFPGGTCHYYQDTDNDRFIVQFTNWTDWATRNGDYTIQIQLHADGRILLLYQNIANPKNGSVGIQDETKTQGLTIAYNDETFFRNNYAVEIKQDPRWLEPSIEAVTLAANESVDFNIEIDASQLVGGNYSSNILLGLPDFHTTIDSVQVDLEIDGVANLQAPNRLEFGNGFVGQEKEHLLEVINLGSDELVIQSVSIDDGTVFSTDANNFSIGPRKDTTIVVRFVPPSIGTYVDTLRLATNDPQFPVRAIALEGVGVRQPNLTVNPDSLGLTLQQGATTTRTFELSNVADADELTYSVGYRTDATATSTVLDKSAIFHGTTPQSDDHKSNDVVEGPKQTHLSPAQGVAVVPTIAQSSLEEIKSVLDQSNGSITSLIPNRHDFTDGETGTNIRDGGEDMYDAGNFLSTNLGGPVDYTNGDIFNHQAFGSASYFTAKYTGLFVLVADLDGVSNFKIEGNLGADGGGSADGSVLQINRSGKTYLGFVKRVFDAGDPSINHLIIIESNGVATHEFSLNTNDDYHEVSNLNEVSRINYLLFSTGGGGDYLDDAKMLEIMEAFVDLTNEETWLTTEQMEGTIEEGQSRDIEFTVDASDLDPGDYEQFIVFSYNSPDSPLEVPVFLEVTGDAPGELSLDRNSIDYGVTTIGDTKRDSVLLTNGGPSAVTVTEIALAHSDFGVDGSSFELAPNASRWIPFVYTAATEGSVAAEALIRHDGAGGDIVITLEARGELAPGELSLDRNSIDYGVATIGDTKRDSVLLTNGGPSTVTITEIALAHSDFEVDGSSFELAPNASRWIPFVYTAETEGSVSAEALIRHDGAGGDIVITLEARGELAPGELSLDRNSIDFGVTTIGDTKRDSVLLTNGGPSAVTVTEIALAHSDFEVDGSSFELAPNESRWIPFVYTSATEGSVAAEALIRHDGAGGGIVITLEARGELAPGELTLDRKSIDFGVTTIGDTKRDSVLLTNGGPSAVTITEIALAHSNFEVDGSSFELAPNASRWLPFVYTAATEGSVSAEAVIRHDGAGADIVVTLEARGELAPGELSLDRNSIDYGVTTIGDTKRDSVLLTNGGPSAVTITEIALAHSDFEVDGSSFELAPNASRWLPFVYTAATEGSVSAEALIRHDGAGGGIVITLEARGELAPGELSLDRNSIDFGVTTIGDTKRDSVLLTNGGPSAVTVTEIALAHSDFEVDGSPFELAPNASRWIPFVYTAATEGSVAAEALIRHDGAGGDIVITLEARGELAPGELSLDRNSIDYGVATIGDTKRDSVLLTNGGPSTVTITEIALAHSDFEVDGSSFELAPNASRWIPFVYTAETEGSVSAEALIRHDGAGGDIVITLEARGELAPGELSLDRNSIDFGVTTIGDTKRDSVLLTNGGPSTVTITEIALAHGDFEVDGSSFELAPNASRWLPFVYTAATEGSVAAEAVIRHDGEGGDLSVVLSGLAEEDSGVPISVSRDSVQFGNVRTSMSALQILTLRNEGNRAVEVLEVIGQDLNFSVTVENSLLEPGDEVQFELLYTPQWEGPQEAELNFVTSIPTTQPVTIQAAGTGVATYLEPATRSLSIPVGSGVATLIVETNLDGFQADSDATWLTFDYEDGDLPTEKKLLINYEANTYFSSRQATIRLYGGGLSRSVIVSQEAQQHYITVSEDSLAVQSDGNVFELSVETSLPDWSVQSLPDWISTSIIDDKVEITCDENASFPDRSHVVVFGNGDIVAEVHIAQEGRVEDPWLRVPVTSFNTDKAGGSLAVAVEANVDYSARTEEDWLSVSKADGGLEVTVERLKGPKDRTATIIVESPGLESVSITIEQTKKDQILSIVDDEPEVVVNIYPNPAQDFLMIESDKMEVVEFYTARGAVVSQMSDIINGKAEIDLRSLEGGMYFLRIQHSDNTFRMEKVIVRR